MKTTGCSNSTPRSSAARCTKPPARLAGPSFPPSSRSWTPASSRRRGQRSRCHNRPGRRCDVPAIRTVPRAPGHTGYQGRIMSENTGPLTADIIVKGCEVVTLDTDNTVINDGAIAVKDGKIIWIGKSAEAGSITADSIIDGRGRIAMPGLVDAHFHTGQQLLRGKLQRIARKRPLKQPVWKNYLIPFESCLEPEDVYLS